MKKETNNDNDVQIAYQNKDIFSKFTAENFKDKQLEIYGVHGLPKIAMRT